MNSPVNANVVHESEAQRQHARVKIPAKLRFFNSDRTQTEARVIDLSAGGLAFTATQPLTVANTGDRPIQVGSHYHFYETNSALDFDRKAARGFRLAIPAGTAVRFEPGQTRDVELVAYAGARQVYGFQGKVMGALDQGGKP